MEKKSNKNLKKAINTRETSTERKEIETTTGCNGSFYSDIDVNFMNPNWKSQQNENKQQAKGVVNKFGTQEEFDTKMQEISNEENYEWVVAIMSIDEINSFVFSKDNDKDAIKVEMDRLEKEMFHLFDIYGNGTNKSIVVNME